MTARDGKNDPQDTANVGSSVPPVQAVSTTPKPATLFPIGKAERDQLQHAVVCQVQRIRDLQAQLDTINRTKREELKKLRARLDSMIEEIENLG